MLEESQTRLSSGTATLMVTPPLTPPAASRDHENGAELTSLQRNINDLPPEGGRTTTMSVVRPQDSALASENMELISFGRTMASSIRVATSSMGSEADTHTARTSLIDTIWTEADEATIHPHADTISLHPIFSRQSKETVSKYVEQLDKDLKSALVSAEGAIERDDGVPTELDRRVFKATLEAARKHSSDCQYATALVPLEILLRKARVFTFIDDVVEKEVTHLMASALVHSGCPDEFRDHILRLYPSVTQEFVLVGLERAKILASRGEHREAILYLEFLLSCPHKFSNVEVILPDDASCTMAACLVKSDFPSEVQTAMAIRFPTVDHHFTSLLSDAALSFDESYKCLKNRAISATHDADLARVRQMAESVRRAMEGWERVRASRELLDTEETKVKLLTIILANLLTDIDYYDAEGEAILLQFTKDPHLDVRLRAKAEYFLAALYLRQVDDWGSSRQHAERAARLYSKCQMSGNEYATSVELFVRACEVLGDPEGIYASKELPADWERTILPTDQALWRMRHYLMHLSKDRPDEALNLGLKFLKTHYIQDVLDLDGSPSQACWGCISLSMKNSDCSFVGHLSHKDSCPEGKCLARSRYPVLEFLGASKMTVAFAGHASSQRSTYKTVLQLITEPVRRSEDSPPLVPLDVQRLLRLAVVNGNVSVVRLIFHETSDPPISQWGLPNQISHIKDGIISLTELARGLRYEDVMTPNYRPRPDEERKALTVLIRRLSAKGLETTLLQTFLGGSVWDADVLNIVMARYFELGGQKLKDGTIFQAVLYNAAVFLGPAVRKGSDPVLGLVMRILGIFINMGRHVKASIGDATWEKTIDSLSLTSTTGPAASSDDMLNFLASMFSYYRNEVERSPHRAALSM